MPAAQTHSRFPPTWPAAAPISCWAATRNSWRAKRSANRPWTRTRCPKRSGTRCWPATRSKPTASTMKSPPSAGCTSWAPRGTIRGASTTRCGAAPPARRRGTRGASCSRARYGSRRRPTTWTGTASAKTSRRALRMRWARRRPPARGPSSTRTRPTGSWNGIHRPNGWSSAEASPSRGPSEGPEAEHPCRRKPNEDGDGEADDGVAAAFGGLILIGVVGEAPRVGGKDAAVGEGFAQGHVDLHPSVHRPARSLKEGAQGPLAEPEERDEHRRPGDEEQQDDDDERLLPQGHVLYALEHGGQGHAYRAHREADGREDAGKLRDVEGRRRGRRRDGLHDLDGLRGRGGHGLVQAGRGDLVLGRGKLGELVADERGHLLVRRPERLPDADGARDDLDNRGVPVAAAAVVEDTVSADEEIIAVPLGESRGDLHGLPARPAAFKVGDEDAAHRRERRVGGDVVHADAKPARAAVEIERAHLEHGGPGPRVEVREVDEIAQQRPQVPGEQREPLDVRERGDLGRKDLVLAEEVLKGFPPGAGEDDVDPRSPKIRNRRGRLGADPGLVRAKLLREVRPVSGGECGLAGAEQRDDRGPVETRERGGPCGVDPLQQRKGLAGLDPGERKRDQRRGVRRKLAQGELPEVLVVKVEAGDAVGVKSGELGAGEVVRDLGANGRHRGEGLRCRRPEGCGSRGTRRLGPCLEGRKVGIEGGNRLLGRLALALDDVLDERPDPLVGRSLGPEHAVALEGSLRDGSCHLHRLFGRDRGRRGAQPRKDPARRIRNGRALGAGGDGVQRERVGALEQQARVLEPGAGPGHGGDHLRRPHVAVAVRIDEGQRALVNLQPLDRAAEGDPELLVQLAQGQQVVGRRKGNLVESARGNEIP